MNGHPLEPLDALEIQQSVLLLKTLATFTPTTRVISVILREPAKSVVHAWDGESATVREASAVLLDNALNAVTVVRLDLSGNRIVETHLAPAGSQPTLSADEQIECEQTVLANDEFKAALQKHYGISDSFLVMVDIWSAGNYGSERRKHQASRPAALLPPFRPDRQRLCPPYRRHSPRR